MWKPNIYGPRLQKVSLTFCDATVSAFLEKMFFSKKFPSNIFAITVFYHNTVHHHQSIRFFCCVSSKCYNANSKKTTIEFSRAQVVCVIDLHTHKHLSERRQAFEEVKFACAVAVGGRNTVQQIQVGWGETIVEKNSCFLF